MPRFKLTVEYAGTRYRGWQIQPNARTVQGEIDAAVRDLSGRDDFELYGSGRTDAGVHALAQVAHLDLHGRWTPADLVEGLNDRLPADINVLAAEPVPHRFHARHSATGRRYLYQVSRRRTAFAKPYVWWVADELDGERMAAGARLCEGMHDFRAFADVAAPRGGEAPSSRVLVERFEVAEVGDALLFRIAASHFLWKMVRRLIGTLVEVGRGRLTVPDVERLLREGGREPAALTAPPSGLFLERVFYTEEREDEPLRPAFLGAFPGP